MAGHSARSRTVTSRPGQGLGPPLPGLMTGGAAAFLAPLDVAGMAEQRVAAGMDGKPCLKGVPQQGRERSLPGRASALTRFFSRTLMLPPSKSTSVTSIRISSLRLAPVWAAMQISG